MKNLLAVLVTGFCLFPLASKSAPSAEARIYCLSLQFQQGSGPLGLYTLDLTTSDPQYSINGEVAPMFNQYGYTHGSYFLLNDPSGFDPMVGTIDLNVPADTDANGNGFPDFFEVSQGVSSTSSGFYSIQGVASGSVQLQWTRNAGSKNGACVITLSSLGSFTHQFELLEYTGPLSYAPGSNTVAGTIDLTQTGQSLNRLQGPVTFKKSSSDRFNVLQLQAGTWTNANAQLLSFSSEIFYRDLARPTNYYGYVVFNDGNPNTAAADYQIWMLSIDDASDGNHNGIPDFSDDVTLARRPKLTLIRSSNNLQLSISGDIGRIHDIQEITSLGLTNWLTTQSFTLTNDPQVLSLSLPSGTIKFWRVQAH